MATRHGPIVTVALVLLLALVVLTGLNGALDASGNEGVPMPVIARGQGDSCVDDTEFIRRYHMSVLKRQHDETTLTGIPADKYSLKECVTCHAVKGSDGSIVTADSPQHFCRTCHDYAAVQIDCFDCHRSRWRRR